MMVGRGQLGLRRLLIFSLLLSNCVSNHAILDDELELQQELQEVERLAFFSGDTNNDGKLSKEEFIAHASDALVGEDAEDAETMTREDAEFAMKQLDEDRDGFITWDEWAKMMFHETPQEPQYRDGEDQSKRSAEEMTVAFRHWDENGDGKLTKPEIERFLSLHGADVGRDSNGAGGLTDDELSMALWQRSGSRVAGIETIRKRRSAVWSQGSRGYFLDYR